ncbi:MAG TPA: type II secretion system F family protein, partial [Candidatus Omnitrophota bacterium]|nr:type II secretion system F family protein [Candidatus Omnitrophota bacterium]
LLKAGVTILRALEIVGAQTRNPNFKAIIATLGAEIRDGRSFSDALSDYPKIFSPFYINLIRVGEESGKLREVLLDITAYQRSQEEILTKLKSAMVYPLFMGGVGLLTVIFILTFVLPRILGLFSSLQENLPLPTAILLSISQFLKIGWYWVILGVILIWFLSSRFINSPRGKTLISRLRLRLPGLGPFTLKVELGRMARTLEILLKSGIPILRALQIATPVLNNELIKEAFSRSQADLAKGNSLGLSLRQSPLIPVVVSDLVVVAEETGSLTEIFHEIAETYEEETKETIKVMTTLMEPVMILVVGSVVGFIVFAMLLPIFQIDALVR